MLLGTVSCNLGLSHTDGALGEHELCLYRGSPSSLLTPDRVTSCGNNSLGVSRGPLANPRRGSRNGCVDNNNDARHAPDSDLELWHHLDLLGNSWLSPRETGPNQL